MAKVPAEERRWGRAPLLRHGKPLREVRERSGMTGRELCRRTGMTAGQLSDVERGIGSLSLHRARELADAFGGQSFAEIVQAVLQDKVDAAGFRFVVVVMPAVPANVVSHDDEEPDPDHGAPNGTQRARSLAR